MGEVEYAIHDQTLNGAMKLVGVNDDGVAECVTILRFDSRDLEPQQIGSAALHMLGEVSAREKIARSVQESGLLGEWLNRLQGIFPFGRGSAGAVNLHIGIVYFFDRIRDGGLLVGSDFGELPNFFGIATRGCSERFGRDGFPRPSKNVLIGTKVLLICPRFEEDNGVSPLQPKIEGVTFFG